MLTLHTGSAAGQQWIGADARPGAMGQAGVAAAKGPAALHWNPAALGADHPPKHFAVQVNGIADLQIEGDAVRRADRLARVLDDLSLDDLQDRFDAARMTEADVRNAFSLIDAIADLLEPGTGAIAHVGADIALQRGPWAVSYRRLSHPGLIAVLDTGPGSGLALADDGLADLNSGLQDLVDQRIASGEPLHQPATAAGRDLSQQLRDIGAIEGILIPEEVSDEFAFQGEQVLGDRLDDTRLLDLLEQVLAATAAAGEVNVGVLTDNQSGAAIRGLTLHEFSVGRGMETPWKPLRLGAVVRVLHGETFIRRFTLREIEEGTKLISEVFDSFNEGTRSSTRVTLDAAASLEPLPGLVLSLSGRNLVPAKFRFSDGEAFHLEPQARGGLSLNPPALSWLTLVFDADLTENHSDALPGVGWQMAGGGIEIAGQLRGLEWALRGGAFINVAQGGAGPVYTAGAELRHGHWFLALSAQVTGDDINVESVSVDADAEDFPERTAVSLSLGFGF